MKNLLYIFLYIIGAFAAVWIFNHLNPWVGIAWGIIYLYICGSNLFNYIKIN